MSASITTDRAKQLLYGPRPSGRRPQINSPKQSFNQLREHLRAGTLPNWITKRCPGLIMIEPASDGDYDNLADSYTYGYLKGADIGTVEVAMLCDCGRMIFSLDYHDAVTGVHGQTPGNRGEQQLLKVMADHIGDEVTVEFGIHTPDQLDAILDHYSDGLTMTLSQFGRDFNSKAAFDEISHNWHSLSSRSRELLDNCQDLDQLLSDSHGRDCLHEALSYDLLTFRRPLTKFS